MCIHYRTTFTNKRIIWNNPEESFYTHFKCGICYECLQERKKEMTFRGYYQALETFKKGGYTLFDSLTYSNQYLPHINEVAGSNLEDNFSCFRRKDVINWLKLLRINLQRNYKETKSISILYTGEYGTDQRYTHRPHYHIIVYYTGKLNPLELSNLIAETWKYGRTDGAPYKGNGYVLNKRVFKDSNSYSLNQLKYVCKYLEKESNFAEMIKLRINEFIKNSMIFDKELTYEDKLLRNKKLNEIRQFSRISNNFGISALDYINKNKLLSGNIFVTIPDHKNIVEQLALPKYYIRKLYQNLVYYNIGHDVLSRWEWNEQGKIFSKNKKDFNFELNKLKINNLFKMNNLTLNPNLTNDLAINESKKGLIINLNIDYVISWNTPKYKDKFKSVIFTNKHIDDNPIYYDYKDFKIYNDDSYDIFLNSLKSKKLENDKIRHKRYLMLKEMYNKAKYLNLI